MAHETINRLGYSIAIVTVLTLATPNVTSAAEVDTFKDRDGQTIHREVVPHTDKADKDVEFFWASPGGQGPWPMIVLIHAHQQKNRDGGKVYVRYGSLGRWAKKGYVTVSVSQPGYGKSDGPPDFCGPFTQNAVRTVIDLMQQKAFVDPERIALYGVSRGAIVAGMIAARYPNLTRALILHSGAYDLAQAYPTGRKGLDKNIKKEAGTSEEAFKARSLLFHVDDIKAAVLILHGGKDDIFPVGQAERLAEKLTAKGLPVQLEIFRNYGHKLPPKKWAPHFSKFITQYLQ